MWFRGCRFSIRAGNNFNDLGEIEQVELSEPSGWVMIPLKDINSQPIRTFMLQIAVLSNHQNGRDTHMRQIKVHSPVQDISVTEAPCFSTVECRQFMHLRWVLLKTELNTFKVGDEDFILLDLHILCSLIRLIKQIKHTFYVQHESYPHVSIGFFK